MLHSSSSGLLDERFFCFDNLVVDHVFVSKHVLRTCHTNLPSAVGMYECPICLCDAPNTRVTLIQCGHWTCFQCYYQMYYKFDRRLCHMCRADTCHFGLDASDYVTVCDAELKLRTIPLDLQTMTLEHLFHICSMDNDFFVREKQAMRNHGAPLCEGRSLSSFGIVTNSVIITKINSTANHVLVDFVVR